jgi:hypothetical protein
MLDKDGHAIFFIKLFGALLDNKKLFFNFVQTYSSREFFCPTEGVRQACRILNTRVNPS